MNIVQEILQKHVPPNTLLDTGEYVLADLDFIYTNGLTMASAIKEINKIEHAKIWDNEKIAIFPDHFTPNKDIHTANLKKQVRDWANKNNIKNYFEVGDVGIEHIQFLEKQFVPPGSLVIGGDSHSCTLGAVGILSLGVGTTDIAFGCLTGKVWIKIPEVLNIELIGKPKNCHISGKDIILYILKEMNFDDLNYRVIVFSGEGCNYLKLSDRITICNMCVEGGAKTALFLPEREFLENIECKKDESPDIENMKNVRNINYRKTIDLEQIECQVALPHSPKNACSIKEVNKMKIKLDQVFIGSCTNGTLDDLKIVAQICNGKRRHERTRVIIIPATPKIYYEALRIGIIETFLNFGAVVCPPSCGPCLGGHMGVIGDGEICLATTNRNFKGRMGSTEAKIYLSSPTVAAYSAIAGYITGPEELI